MKNIVIVAESGSDINQELAKEYDITIVPMHVSFHDNTLDDGSFPIAQIFDFYQKTGELPKTSGCTPNDFEKVFDELHSQYPQAHILYLAYSSVTTCSYQSATIAAYGRDYITMVDSRQVSLGHGAIVMEVAKRLMENPNISLIELVAYANDCIQRAHMCFLPNDLEYLKAGGRVSNMAYIGAKLLHLHPVIEIIDGKLKATKKYRGKLMRVACQMLMDYTEMYQLHKDCLWMIYTFGLAEDIKKEMEAMAKTLGYQSIIWVQANGVITTHAGPSSIGFVGFTK